MDSSTMGAEQAGTRGQRFPPQIKYIIGNEACERFSYYGMLSILTLYLKNVMALAAGMCIVVHPGVKTERQFMTIVDNYLIGPDGPGECLHRSPKSIIEIG